MAVAETGGGSFLFTGSASNHGITTYSISGGGALSQIATLSDDDSLPVATLTGLDVAQVGGNTFLIAAASGTSSLTVLTVSDQGDLAVTDHVLDGLDTRFQGVSSLEVVQMGAHAFVMASGMDDGLSLFRLTHDGHLTYADTIADSTTTTLDGVSALVSVVHDTWFDVMVTSASGAGMTLFRVEFDPSGIFQSNSSGHLNGANGSDVLTLGNDGAIVQGGDDILRDGGGEDQMRGGEGADTFVFNDLTAGEYDVITDFDEDRDIVRLQGIAGSNQATRFNNLDISQTSQGFEIQYDGHTILLEGVALGDLERSDMLLC